MPKLAYNDRAAKGAASRDGKRTKYSISGHPGLVLDVTPGTPEPSRRWFVRYQVGRGESRRQGYDAIGDIKHWSVGQAWDEASGIIREAQGGTDPKAEREAVAVAKTSDARTLEAVYREWLARPSRKLTLRNRSRDAYEQQFKHVAATLGHLPISALTTDQIKIAIERIRVATTNTTRGHRGYMATKALKLIRSICRYALDKTYIERDPTRGVDLPVAEANPAGKQSRPPTDEELRRIWVDAPRSMVAQNVRILKIGLLLGKRVSEIVNARKSEVVLGHDAHWTIPGTTEGNKSREDQVVPLPPLAAALLAEQIKEADGSPFVFPAKGLPEQPTTRNTPSQAFKVLRRTIGIDDQVRFHDIRGLIIDHMAKLRVPSEYRSHILHHTGDMRASLADSTYSTWDYMDLKRRALELWERRLLEIVEGRPPSGLHW